MARHAHEFQCDGSTKGRAPNMAPNPSPSDNCGWYNYPMLDDTMHGNFTIICGHCGHKHYRTIKMGVITHDRHSDNMGEEQVLHIMPSACSPTKRTLGSIAQIRQMEAAGLMK